MIKIKGDRKSEDYSIDKELDNMSFKIPVGKELDDLLDQLTINDIERIRSDFEFDVQKENFNRMINSNIQPVE
ncbi:hypothetical protein [Lactobacillus helveticus]|uniref:Uncharacterized protein n=1 Tax=Lactobacillus helveticus CIRM-BIA 104 TaxID=1226333 RepID=U6FGL3_LACHE|nr:hypothetical protein [Lactobacillus helveticus]KXN79854.1 hypothetical protein AY470_06605 [Lactobacillus helveticus]MCT3409030.1 hypothetical protein [Lactobacillus helveticus]MCT3424930.1 hypothetical protein [Lactobacillus helveticus]PXZ17277.1 hypothetical protein DM475_10845 [Lactobacillus helveticus]CDI61696.1 Protein of unknown function [Lactobacillus helveticus CIRM-BIA 104]